MNFRRPAVSSPPKVHLKWTGTSFRVIVVTAVLTPSDWRDLYKKSQLFVQSSAFWDDKTSLLGIVFRRMQSSSSIPSHAHPQAHSACSGSPVKSWKRRYLSPPPPSARGRNVTPPELLRPINRGWLRKAAFVIKSFAPRHMRKDPSSNKGQANQLAGTFGMRQAFYLLLDAVKTI